LGFNHLEVWRRYFAFNPFSTISTVSLPKEIGVLGLVLCRVISSGATGQQTDRE
jgi:hypothetical protein